MLGVKPHKQPSLHSVTRRHTTTSIISNDIIFSLHVLNGSTEGMCGGSAIQGLLAESKVCKYHVTISIQHDILWLQVSG